MSDTVVSLPPTTERPPSTKPPLGRRFDATSAAAQARVRRRYRAEARFKAYGVIALTLTTIFLVVLLADILIRGLPAFWQYSVVLDVPVKAEEIDPGNKRTELAEQSARQRAERRNWLDAPAVRPGTRRQRARSAAADSRRRLLRSRPAGALRCFPRRRRTAGAAQARGAALHGCRRPTARSGGRRRRSHRQDGQDKPALVGQRRPLHEGRGHAVPEARWSRRRRHRAAPPARSPC